MIDSLATADVNLSLVHLLLLLLLNDRLNKSRLACQVYSVLLLKIIDVIGQEAFIVAQLLTNWNKANLVDGTLGSHGLK